LKVQTKKILIVDDDSDMRIFLSNLFETLNFRPILAKSCSEGMKKALTEKPEIIILDVPMPEKRGLQMHQNLKNDDRLKDIPVIMISTLDRKTLLQYQRSFKLVNGQDIHEPEAYLKKPLEAEDLLVRVREIAGNFDKINTGNI